MSSNQSAIEQFWQACYDKAQSIQLWYQIFLIIFGFLGNSITVFILWRTKITLSKRIGIYLISLAVSDTGFLLNLLIQMISEYWVDSKTHAYSVLCKSNTFFGFLLNYFSVMLVLAFTLQRFASIRFPLHQDILQLERKSKFIIPGILLVGCLFFSVTFALYGIEKGQCKGTNEFLAEMISFADALLTLIIPFFAILVMNIIIIRTLKKSQYDCQIVHQPDNRVSFRARSQPQKALRTQKSIQSAVNVGVGTADALELSPKTSRLASFKSRLRRAQSLKREIPNRGAENSMLVFKANQRWERPTARLASSEQASSTDSSSERRHETRQDKKTGSERTKDVNLEVSVLGTNRPGKDRLKRSRSLFARRPKVNRDSMSEEITHSSLRISNARVTLISKRVTKMLILISSTFLLLNLPYLIFTVATFITVRIDNRQHLTNAEGFFEIIARNFFYTTFSCNFLLYSISGTTFRNELKAVITKMFRLKC
nr:G protein-coupled receptor [Proales similis]